MVAYELVHWLTLEKSEEKKKHSATTTAYARSCHHLPTTTISIFLVCYVWRTKKKIVLY